MWRLPADPKPGRSTVSRLNADDGPQLLDLLPPHVAIGACELFGAVATLGRTPDLKRLTDDEWHAGVAGFEIFAGGEAGVADFLEGLRKSYRYSGAATHLEVRGSHP
jgi:hypothetical protein